MEEIKLFLDSYGLKIERPTDKEKWLSIVIREKSLKKQNLKNGIMWLCVFGYSIRPKDIGFLFEKKMLPEKYRLIEPLLEELLRLEFYSAFVEENKTRDKAIWNLDIEYATIEREIEQQVGAYPQKYGLSLEKLEIIGLFGSKSAEIKKEARKRYDLLMDFVENYVQQDDDKLIPFMEEFELITKDKNLGEEWFRE